MKVRWHEGGRKVQGDVINAVVVEEKIYIVIKGEDSLIHIVSPEDIVP